MQVFLIFVIIGIINMSLTYIYFTAIKSSSFIKIMMGKCLLQTFLFSSHRGAVKKVIAVYRDWFQVFKNKIDEL